MECAPPSLIVTVIVTGEPAGTQTGALHVTVLLVPVFDEVSRSPMDASQEKVSSRVSAS
jgi:hypothetical protein